MTHDIDSVCGSEQVLWLVWSRVDGDTEDEQVEAGDDEPLEEAPLQQTTQDTAQAQVNNTTALTEALAHPAETHPSKCLPLVI